MSANQLSLNVLRQFAPASSPLFAYQIESTGSPMHDWARHLAANDLYRRNLEESYLLGGNLVVRAVEGDEKPALEQVKILSLTYALRVFGNAEDAKEFIRGVKAIADPKADRFELEQIASHYYREIKHREIPEVLKEMALLGMEMTRVTAEVKDLEIECNEVAVGEIKLSAADQKRVRAAQKNRPKLPTPTPNFDAEMKAIENKLSSSRVTKAHHDEFAGYYLSDEGKSLEELDEDYQRFEAHEQYDEDGLLGLKMSGSSHTEIVLELDAEITPEYLPYAVQPLARHLQFIFVGYEIGGRAAQSARYSTACRKIENRDKARAREAFRLNVPFIETIKPQLTDFSVKPLSEAEISEWIDLELDAIYSREAVRVHRRLGTLKTGKTVEFLINQTINPDYDEKQYACQILHILLQQMERDFHLSSLRRNELYQTIYRQIRGANDTLVLAQTGDMARRAKEEKRLTLKEYTTLSTVAKSQFAKLNAARPSSKLFRLEKEISSADSRKIGYLKWAMYGQNKPDHSIHSLPKQEVHRAWTALKSRELILKEKATAELNRLQQMRQQFIQPAFNFSQVKVTPIMH